LHTTYCENKYLKFFSFKLLLVSEKTTKVFCEENKETTCHRHFKAKGGAKAWRETSTR